MSRRKRKNRAARLLCAITDAELPAAVQRRPVINQPLQHGSRKWKAQATKTGKAEALASAANKFGLRPRPPSALLRVGDPLTRPAKAAKPPWRCDTCPAPPPPPRGSVGREAQVAPQPPRGSVAVPKKAMPIGRSMAAPPPRANASSSSSPVP